jgi:heme oxygenase
MDGDAAIAPAHRLLREHTRDAHDAAEATEGMRALMSGAMDEVGYHGLLAAQLQLFVAWEHERAGEITAAADAWAYESRVPHLQTDLSARIPFLQTDLPARIPFLQTDLSVGAHPVRDIFRDTAPSLEGLSRKMSRTGCAPTTATATAEATAGPEFWGELYVIEGSTLGGQVIVRQLRTQFPGLPHAYYAMGESAPGQWRGFQQVLDRMLPDHATQSLAIAGAQRMFARFQRTLQDPGHHV